MAAITLKLPEELAERLRIYEDCLPEIIDRGLRGIETETPGGFSGTTEVLEFRAGLPSPQEVLGLRPLDYLARRVEELLEKNRSGGLSPQEEKRVRELRIPGAFGPNRQNQGLCETRPKANTVHLMILICLEKLSRVVAHFALHPTRIDPIPAGDNTFLNLIEYSFVQGFSVQRGE